MIKVAINGFGRIGRIAFRALCKRNNIEVVAVNDLTDSATLAHLLKYDSVHGRFSGKVTVGAGELNVDGKIIKVCAERAPEKLPWKELGIDVVIESTGFFRSRDAAMKHLTAGAKKVIISAPPKGDDVKNIVLGVNDNILTPQDDIVSNASCTTNCAAQMIKVIDDNWKIAEGFISTIHAYTGDQRLHDAPHEDLRRARAAANSIIPTSTGAAQAIRAILPHLEGKIGGCAIRVPVIDGSLADVICFVEKTATVEEINSAFRNASNGAMKGILEYNEDPIVSVDIIGNTHSCIFSPDLTSVGRGKMIKVSGWYDNESGYSQRLADLAERIK